LFFGYELLPEWVALGKKKSFFWQLKSIIFK